MHGICILFGALLIATSERLDVSEPASVPVLIGAWVALAFCGAVHLWCWRRESTMKFGKDGGPLSTVCGYWLVEIKRLLSIVLLRFDGASREAFHSHAFHCISWVLRGRLIEQHLDGRVETHGPSLLPVITRRSTFHKVDSVGRTWVLSFRGPWSRTWKEFIPASGEVVTLGSGRRVISRES